MISVKITRVVAAVASLSMANMAQSALTVQNGSSSQARIGWGDSLDNAKAIMYDEIQPKAYSSYNDYNSSQATAYEQDYKQVYNDIYSDNNSNNNSERYIAETYNSNPYNSSANGYNGSDSSYNSYNSNSYNNTYNNYDSYNGYNGYNSANDYDKLAINTGSRGVMVVDLLTGKPIYEKNTNTARPIASITKLMTAMVVLDAGQNMQEEIQLTGADFKCIHKTCKSSSSKLRVGDRLNRSEWLLMMLMKSENPSAKTLARHYPGGYNAFMRAMNRKARDLGMYNTFFGDPTGLDKRNKSSPADLVKMIKEAGKYQVIRRYSTTPYHDFYVTNYARGNRTYNGRSTSYLVRNKSYPIGISKTGYIRESGRCMVMETRVNNRPAIVVLLGAKSYATRNTDAERILASLSSRYI